MNGKLSLCVALIVLCLVCGSTLAAGEPWSPGARYAGMGGCSTALADSWSACSNQAGLALVEHPAIGLAYENRFGLGEVSSKSLLAIWPTKFGVLGATTNYFGYRLYNELKAGLLYARSFGPYLQIGVQLDYLQTSIAEGYGSSSRLTFELGIQSRVSETITLGAWVYNPIKVKLSGAHNESIASIFKLGLGWNISSRFLATVESEKNTNTPALSIRAGAEYNIKERFYIRLGMSNNRDLFSMGFGFNYKAMQIDIAASSHESLGFSTELSLIFQFKKPAKRR